jgi:1-aminocyclopropane-1-carboxylate deaminase
MEIVVNQQIYIPGADVSLYVKREDLLHPLISGNKFRKLKYNLEEARNLKKTTLLTFGGAFSNHIVAVAAAGREYGFETIGIIRGEELVNKVGDNPSLSFAAQCGMKLIFTPRQQYRSKNIEELKNSKDFIFESCYIIPEGGTNNLAVQGCEEILSGADTNFDFVCCAVGTGGTISGLINSAADHQQILGFPALKGNFLADDVQRMSAKENWQLVNGYEFGGYAKVNVDLINFINDFKMTSGIQLDPVYTGKMFFGVMDMVRKNWFPSGAKILAIHTGGLQGITGMNLKLKNKNLPIIKI